MTSLQYDRYIRVRAGGIDVNPVPGADQLRVAFEYMKAADENAPEGRVDIYNLSRRNHERIETLYTVANRTATRDEAYLAGLTPYDVDTFQSSGLDIFVDAGYTYARSYARVIDGKAKRVIKTRVDHAFVTRIFLTDLLRVSGRANGTVNVAENDPSISAKDIIRKIVVEDMRLAVGDMDAIPDNAIYPNFVASGNPLEAIRTVLDGITAEDGRAIKPIVDNNTVSFARGISPIPSSDTIVKTPDNGLVGVPDIEEEGKATFRMLLDPRVRVGSTIEVRGSDFMDDDHFTITKVTHRGDNWTGQFVTIAESGKEVQIAKDRDSKLGVRDDAGRLVTVGTEGRGITGGLGTRDESVTTEGNLR